MHSNLIALSAVLLVSYGMMCLLCCAMIAYMRYNRHVAHKGDSTAARKILLPAFEPLLWILGIATGLYATYFAVALTIQQHDYDIPSIPNECFYAGRMFVLMLVIVFMFQKSVTIPALRRAVLLTLLLSTYTIPVVWYIVAHNAPSRVDLNYWLLTLAHALVLALFVYVAVRPPGRASKATLRQYCAFAFVEHMLEFAYMAAFRQREIKLGFAFIYADLLWGAMCPIFIWRVLKADTEHWRGMGHRACALQHEFRHRANVNERISSEGLHVLIEMHLKYIIDFAYLEVKQRIGVGSSAVVYNGILKSKTPVAIKVYTPTTVTEETVAAFSHEAALCGALNHPNIVKFYGMCVSPPTICLVSELCQGSLDVVTVAIAKKRAQEPHRQQLLIDLGYMIDAARAVAYIHSFTPAFVHRDIKPDNFLVDEQGNVKLTDFGESRSLPKAKIEWDNCATFVSDSKSNHGGSDYNSNSATTPTTGGTVLGGLDDNLEAHTYQEYSTAVKERIRSLSGASPLSKSNLRRSRPRAVIEMTVKGTADYMAPEIINGKGGVAAYGEAADVYSLAVTMWDILNPGVEKYPSTHNNHLLVFEVVTAGTRPPLDPMLHQTLSAIITQGWDVEPRNRPSAQAIVHALERIQEEMCAVFALELSEDLEHDYVVAKTGHHSSAKCFTGQQGIAKLRDSGSVCSSREGIRLGNMLMDAGFLHHVKHSRAYDYNDALYFFDDENIQLCQSFAMLERGRPRDSDDDSQEGKGERATSTTTPTHRIVSPPWSVSTNTSDRRKKADAENSRRITTLGVEILGDGDSHGCNSGGAGLHNDMDTCCACQKLGRRLDNRKTARRRFRRRYKTIPEENLLTVHLLREEMSATQNQQFLDEFSESGEPIIISTQE